MEHQTVPVTPLLSRSAKRRRFFGRAFLATLGILLALALDFSPAVPEVKPPTGEQAQRVRGIVEQLRAQLRGNNGLATLRLDRGDLTSAATLASALKKFGRIDGLIDNKAMTVRVSRPFGFLWVNGEMRVGTSAKGFPDVALQIGDLPLGRTLSRWIVQLARHIVRRRGVDVPPVNDLVRSIDVQTNAVSINVHLPLGGAFANDLSNFRSQPVDAAQTAAIYCQLIEINKKSPTTDMATVVRRAFAQTASALPIIEQNRSALVALAMYAVSPDSGRLAGDASQRIRACRATHDAPLLAGRTDLANHWALSAALAVSLGDDVGRAMGEWKELSDSRPGGTGFSFVDLAADRAGLALARRATDPATAAATAKRLQSADAGYLLPIRALALSEGLSEQQFVAGFKTINSAQFDAAKARIDAVLTKSTQQAP